MRDCEKNPPEDRPESAAFLEIDEIRPGEDNIRRFSGWMFAQSPALSSLENPVYDVILLDCKGASGSPPESSGSTTGKDAPIGERRGEQPVITGARDLDTAELRQMRGQELGVEQTIAAEPQPRDQMDQGHLARVGLAAEHAFAEERRTDRDAV